MGIVDKRKKSSTISKSGWLSILVILLGLGYWFIEQDGKQQIERYWREPIQGPSIPKQSDGGLTFEGEPRPISPTTHFIRLENSSFLVAYDESRKNPAWAAYRIPAKRLQGEFPRPSRFSIDTRTQSRISHDDYTGSGFDRGHMTPNFAIASRFGAKAQSETFLMSNVAPQQPALNQGPWRLLEDVLANKTAVNDEEIWVVVGPIYHGNEERLKSGSQIPFAFFMVIADQTPTGPRLQAFILPQSTPRNANFRDYLTTVDDVQNQSGLDFFWELPDPEEHQLESNMTKYWLEN